MQTQTSPLIYDGRPPIISEYAEPTTGGIEADLITKSEANGGQHVILGERLDATDQTDKVIRAVASNGHLLISNLTPYTEGLLSKHVPKSSRGSR